MPPTTDYHLIAEEQYKRTLRHQKLVGSAFAFLVLVAAILIGYVTIKQHQNQQIASLQKFPKVSFYFYDFPEFASLSRTEKSESIFIAIQSFEDHFGLKLDEYEILHNEVPESLSFLSTGYFSEMSTFRFWDEQVFDKNIREWLAKDREPLNVLITNLPIYLGASNKIEARHLDNQKLISGLGHPSLVLASSYRLLNELKLSSSNDRSRHLGEYVIAHELGHGLMGLPDYIIKEPMTFMRGPASATESTPLKHCLMHTDEGGGTKAWDYIKNRPLGIPSPCNVYSELLKATKLREDAIDLAKAGKLQEAYDKMTVALATLDNQKELSKSWIKALWQKEHKIMKPSVW